MIKYKGRFSLFNSINNNGCGKHVMPDDCFKKHRDVKIGVGGYYNEIEYDASANGVLTVKKARLRHLGMTLAPVNDAYYLEIAEE